MANRPTSKLSRQRTGGVSLVAVLLSFLMLSSLALAVQQQTVAYARVVVRLTERHLTSLEDTSAHEIAKPLIGASITSRGRQEDGIPMNGVPVIVSMRGQAWSISIQDMSSLPALHGRTSNIAHEVLAQVTGTSAKPSAEEFLDLHQYLLLAGTEYGEIERAARLVQLKPTHRKLNRDNMPHDFDFSSVSIPRRFLTTKTGREVRIEILETQ